MRVAFAVLLMVAALWSPSAAGPPHPLLKVEAWDVAFTFHGRDTHATADHEAAMEMTATNHYPDLVQTPPGMPVGLALVPTLDPQGVDDAFVFGPLPASGQTISGSLVKRGYPLPPFGTHPGAEATAPA